MTRPASERSDKGLRARKLRDCAILLPVAGLVLFMPPVAGIFALPGRVFGVPAPVAYLFFVWIALILAARMIGRRLIRGDRGD